MTYDEILQKMKTTPWNWYYVCGGNDPDSWEKYRVRREELDYIGSDINTMGLPAWWVGVDTYDFSGVDKFLDALLKDYPARYFVPRIKMDPPLDWLKENPKDVCVYYGGPTSEQEIAEMVGSKYHDRNGWDDGKTRNPYPDQRIANQSFSSKKWVEDACKALSAFVEHIENGPYKDQTIGYMPAFGNCGECMWWGDWRNQGDPRKGDFGLNHKKYFYEWAVEKYGSEDALKKALELKPENRYQDVKTFWRDLNGKGAVSTQVLQCIQGCYQGKYMTSNQETLFGTDSSRCHICYPAHSEGISRIQIRIWKSDQVFMAMDMGSSYGTYLNQSRLTPGLVYRLSEGDLLQFGTGEIFRVIQAEIS